MLLSLPNTKYTKIKWNDIKGSKDESDGYGTYDNEFKKYYQDGAKNNGFESSMTNFIKKNYFDKVGNTLPLSFEGDLIYKSSDMDTYSLFNVVNSVKSYNDEKSFKTNYNTDEGRLLLNTVFRNDPNKSEAQQSLVNYYFTNNNYKIWEEQQNTLKEKFLAELSIDDTSSINQTSEFKSSLALGYVNLTGLSINFSNEGYIHELPDFRIAVNYLIDVQQPTSKVLDNLAKFFVKNLKAWHKTMGLSYGYEYPKYNSAQDFLMVIKESELTKKFVENNIKIAWNPWQSFSFFLNFSLTDNQHNFGLAEERIAMLNQANLSEDSQYSMGFHKKTAKNGSWMWNYTDFNWVASENGIKFEWNDQGFDENNSIMLWDLGYMNFYIDLDQITLGTKELATKDFIKFI